MTIQFNSILKDVKLIKLLYAAYREIKNIDGRATRTTIDKIIMAHQAVNRVILLAANRTKKQAGLRISYCYRLISRGYDENSSRAFIRRFESKDRFVRKPYTVSFNTTSLCKKNCLRISTHKHINFCYFVDITNSFRTNISLLLNSINSEISVLKEK